ncbi:Hypothetical_protein [Hexamita inflata]|uniref:Hypothetical_protein n=2 Tax=Hexamita inflata TaxID=28002 RepID=A0AA86UH71_9EUKA|nr:Hypothetical protein HINF_LOCUS45675 [Hexamita inflata]
MKSIFQPPIKVNTNQPVVNNLFKPPVNLKTEIKQEKPQIQQPIEAVKPTPTTQQIVQPAPQIVEIQNSKPNPFVPPVQVSSNTFKPPITIAKADVQQNPFKPPVVVTKPDISQSLFKPPVTAVKADQSQNIFRPPIKIEKQTIQPAQTDSSIFKPLVSNNLVNIEQVLEVAVVQDDPFNPINIQITEPVKPTIDITFDPFQTLDSFGYQSTRNDNPLFQIPSQQASLFLSDPNQALIDKEWAENTLLRIQQYRHYNSNNALESLLTKLQQEVDELQNELSEKNQMEEQIKELTIEKDQLQRELDNCIEVDNEQFVLETKNEIKELKDELAENKKIAHQRLNRIKQLNLEKEKQAALFNDSELEIQEMDAKIQNLEQFLQRQRATAKELIRTKLNFEVQSEQELSSKINELKSTMNAEIESLTAELDKTKAVNEHLQKQQFSFKPKVSFKLQTDKNIGLSEAPKPIEAEVKESGPKKFSFSAQKNQDDDKSE